MLITESSSLLYSSPSSSCCKGSILHYLCMTPHNKSSCWDQVVRVEDPNLTAVSETISYTPQWGFSCCVLLL